MKKTIDAVYENGLFRPLEQPELADGQHVRLAVIDSPTQFADAAQKGGSETQTKQLPEATLAPVSRTLAQLANDPAFQIPSRPIAFDPVEPIKNTGKSASDLLVEDRR